MKKYIWPMVFTAALFSISANAEDFFSLNKDSVYATVSGGAALPNSTDISGSGLVTGSGKLHYKTGYNIDGTLGIHLNSLLAAEAELGYSKVKYDHLSGSLSTALGSGTGSISTVGNASAVTGLINGVITPFHSNGVSPYIGAGVGFAATHAGFNSIGGVSAATLNLTNENKTDLAADFIAGIDVPVSHVFSLGARYQYLWINSKYTSSNSGQTLSQGNSGANIITARATYHF